MMYPSDPVHAMTTAASAIPAGSSRPAPTRVAGLDALRILCATIVVFSHCRVFPLFAGRDPDFIWADRAESVYSMFFSGTAAVIVFFVISGFCIQYGWEQAQEVSAFRFVLRRWVRIWIPLLAAMLLANLLQLHFSLYYKSVLWSLYCELIYYSLFPMLAGAVKRYGWSVVLSSAYAAALAVILTNPAAKILPDYGLLGTWVVCGPCWLLGCLLAENFLSAHGQALTDPPWQHVWAWRAVIVATIPFTVLLRFHGGIGHPWTMNLFAVLVYFWLTVELRHLAVRPPHRLLEAAGTISYSVYIVHRPIYHVLQELNLPVWGAVADWVGMIFTIYLCSTVFYLLIERPSHRLARRLSYNRRTRSAPPQGEFATEPVAASSGSGRAPVE